MQPFYFRKAFSLLELVFVITILGVVASIGAELISKMYGNYILQRSLYKSSNKTELVATQIANRLVYAIPNTVIARQSNTVFVPLENAPATGYPILEWTGYDADSFSYTATPGWSGFNDVDAGTATSISSPGSTLSIATTVINNLNGTINDSALFYPGTYTPHTIGYSESTRATPVVSHVSGVLGSTFTLTTATVPNREMKEHYKLSWTAYAIVPTQLTTAQLQNRGFESGDLLYDLKLYYNYQPWEGETYSDGSDNTLIRNVSVFNFTGIGDTIRFKLCVQQSIGTTTPVSTCKEKAVIR